METYNAIYKLKELLDEGIISQEEFDEKKMEILFPVEFEEEKRRKQKEEEDRKKQEEERSRVDANNAVLYAAAVRNINSKDAGSYRDAISILKRIGDWRDAPVLLRKCEKELPELEKKEKIEKAEHAKKEVYDNAITKLNKQTVVSHNEAIKDLESLGDWEDARNIIEKSKKELPALEEKEEKEKQELEKKKAKKKKTIIIGSIAIACAIVMILITTNIIIPKAKYNKAMNMIESGEYDAAYALLEELGDTETIRQNKHDRGLALIESGDYDSAYTLLEQSGDTKTIMQNKYDRGLALIESSDYDSAYNLLKGLEFDNSGEYFALCGAKLALQSLTKKDYSKAVSYLKTIENYRKKAGKNQATVDEAFSKTHDEAVNLINKEKKYTVAKTIFEGIQYEDSDKYIEYCNLAEIVNGDLEEENLSDLMSSINKLNNFNDANDLITNNKYLSQIRAWEGTWKNIEGDMNENHTYLSSFKIDKDGYIYRKSGPYETFKYVWGYFTIDNGKLRPCEDEYGYLGEISVSGNIMTLNPDSRDDYTYTLVRE